MTKDLVLVDREALLIELRTVFDGQTSDTLLRVLDKVAAQVYAAGVSREDFSELKHIIAELAEEQRKLAEAQRRTEERLSKLEEKIEQLTSTVSILAEQMRTLVVSQQKVEERVGKLQGRVLELTYRDKAIAYFGPMLRRPKAINLYDLWDTLETHLSSKELDDVLLIDLVVMGKPRHRPDIGELWLAVEISSVVEQKDVERARQRADLFRKAGFQAVPVVAGENTRLEAEADARAQGVAVLQNGRSFLWDEALALWTKS